MKSAKGKVSDTQAWWLEHLGISGYKTAVCYSFDEAKNEILEYLKN
jgi:CMP-2-keto-3-deoxyoctulosonic acid synthetase